jgi:hypothetical protein
MEPAEEFVDDNDGVVNNNKSADILILYIVNTKKNIYLHILQKSVRIMEKESVLEANAHSDCYNICIL